MIWCEGNDEEAIQKEADRRLDCSGPVNRYHLRVGILGRTSTKVGTLSLCGRTWE